MKLHPRRSAFASVYCFVAAAHLSAGELSFESHELASNLGVGYAVRLVDVNDDDKLDVAIVDQTRVVWLENPTWEEHVILDGGTPADNVCFAPHDIDGDGDLDFALGAGWGSGAGPRGTLHWLRQGDDPAAPWDLFAIGAEPSTHRMRWVDLEGDGAPELVVAPLFGPNTTGPDFAEAGVRLAAFTPPADPATERWTEQLLNDDLHVAHNFWPTDLDGDEQTDLLVASFEGVSLLRRDGDAWTATRIGAGDQASRPSRGASEIKLGRLADGSPYIATIEPWHGSQVVVYTPPADGSQLDSASPPLWTRTVIDDDLAWGHAVWCANLDGDADEELIIGVRDDRDGGGRRGVRIFDPTGDSPSDWIRMLVEPGVVAVEDLAAADLDGDGRIDFVAVGRQTHNARVYYNRTEP